MRFCQTKTMIFETVFPNNEYPDILFNYDNFFFIYFCKLVFDLEFIRKSFFKIGQEFDLSFINLSIHFKIFRKKNPCNTRLYQKSVHMLSRMEILLIKNTTMPCKKILNPGT